MPRKSARQTGIEIIGFIVLAVIVVVIALISMLYKFIAENPWLLILIPVIGIPVLWFYLRQKKLDDQKAEEQRLQKENEEREQEETRIREEREKEEKRVENIRSHKNEWGEEMCQWLIDRKIDTCREPSLEIMNSFQEWGQDTCKSLLDRKIQVGMTTKMIQLAFGNPTTVDEKLLTAKEEKYRWIYGRPRLGATYIWFKNDKVTKIKQ